MPQKRPAERQYPITLRLSPKLRAKCQKAAEARGMLLSQFLRHAAALVASATRDAVRGHEVWYPKRNKRGEPISPNNEQGSR